MGGSEVIRHKSLVDQAVAQELGMTHRQVSLITAEFIRQLSLHLVDYGNLTIERLGRFRVEKVNSPRYSVLVTGNFKKGSRRATRLVAIPHYLRVHFSKSPALKAMLKEHYEDKMEKYGVDEGVDQETLEKKAAKGCPECGRQPTRHGRVLVCPEHGTEPFEEPGET